jgi:hypothetical protein
MEMANLPCGHIGICDSNEPEGASPSLGMPNGEHSLLECITKNSATQETITAAGLQTKAPAG